jgi:hypothetical protein
VAVILTALDEHNERILRDLPDAEQYRFPSLLSRAELLGDEIPLRDSLDPRTRPAVSSNWAAQWDGTALPPGHRLRLAISTSDWPLAWPPPEPVRLSVFTKNTRLRLPVWPSREHDEVSLRPFDDPEGAPPIPVTQ